MTANPLATFLRDEIVRLLGPEVEEARREGDGILPTVEGIDEGDAAKLVVVDRDANCFRVTVEQI